MKIYVVRHACAGHKAEWAGADRDRPLDGAGRVQARDLAAVLTHAQLTSVATSPTRRCIDTVAPTATAHHLPVLRHPDLASPETGARFILASVEGRRRGMLVCTHGEVLTLALDALRDRGVVVDGDRSDDDLLLKGGMWVLRHAGGRWTLELVLDAALGSCPQHTSADVERATTP